MFTAASKGNIFGILRWQWKKVVLFAGVASERGPNRQPMSQRLQPASTRATGVSLDVPDYRGRQRCRMAKSLVGNGSLL